MTRRFARFPRRRVHRGAPCTLLLAAACLVGFVRISFTPGSAPFRWAQMPVSYVIQARGSADVPDLSDDTAVRLGFQAWEDLPAAAIRFSEDVGADASRTDYPATDVHLVLWDEDGSSGLFAPGAGIIALTPLLASTSDGTILDADIVFNGALQFSTDLAAGSFDVQSVATHEVGHLLGFDHTGGPLVTMFAAIQAGQTSARSLSRDDEAAAAHVYPAGATGRGRISGAIAFQGGPGVRFPLVVAVDEATGELAGSALGGSSGAYGLEGLPPGIYRLYAEPLDGPFAPGDTIALQGQTVDGFDTTWFPGGPVTLAAGQSLGATWTVTGTGALNAAGASGTQILAGTGRSLTVSGTGLDQVTRARVTGTGVQVTGLAFLPTLNRLRLELAAAAGAGPGVRCLELLDSNGRTAILTGQVEAVSAPPAVSSVVPALLRASGGELLTITGRGFTQGVRVVVGGQLATQVSVLSDARVDCTTPPSPGLAGPLDVVVIRPDGLEGRLRGAVSYESVPVPTSIDPAFGPVQGGTTHVVQGGGFVQGMQVRIGPNQATILALTGTEARILLPAGLPGPADVTCSFGNAEAVLPGALTYVDAAAPVVGAFSPTSGPTSGGTAVTITGSGFPADAQVSFGGVAASNVTVSGGATIACLSPPHGPGAVEVRVRDPATQLVGIAPTSFSYDGTAPPPAGGGGGGGGCALARGGAPRPPGGLGLLPALLLLGIARRRRPAG